MKGLQATELEALEKDSDKEIAKAAFIEIVAMIKYMGSFFTKLLVYIYSGKVKAGYNSDYHTLCLIMNTMLVPVYIFQRYSFFLGNVITLEDQNRWFARRRELVRRREAFDDLIYLNKFISNSEKMRLIRKNTQHTIVISQKMIDRELNAHLENTKMDINEFLSHLQIQVDLELDGVFTKDLKTVLEYFRGVDQFIDKTFPNAELEIKIDLMRLILRMTDARKFVVYIYILSSMKVDFLNECQIFALFCQVLLNELQKKPAPEKQSQKSSPGGRLTKAREFNLNLRNIGGVGGGDYRKSRTTSDGFSHYLMRRSDSGSISGASPSLNSNESPNGKFSLGLQEDSPMNEPIRTSRYRDITEEKDDLEPVEELDSFDQKDDKDMSRIFDIRPSTTRSNYFAKQAGLTDVINLSQLQNGGAPTSSGSIHVDGSLNLKQYQNQLHHQIGESMIIDAEEAMKIGASSSDKTVPMTEKLEKRDSKTRDDQRIFQLIKLIEVQPQMTTELQDSFEHKLEASQLEEEKLHHQLDLLDESPLSDYHLKTPSSRLQSAKSINTRKASFSRKQSKDLTKQDMLNWPMSHSHNNCPPQQPEKEQPKHEDDEDTNTRGDAANQPDSAKKLERSKFAQRSQSRIHDEEKEVEQVDDAIQDFDNIFLSSTG